MRVYIGCGPPYNDKDEQAPAEFKKNKKIEYLVNQTSQPCHGAKFSRSKMDLIMNAVPSCLLLYHQMGFDGDYGVVRSCDLGLVSISSNGEILSSDTFGW